MRELTQESAFCMFELVQTIVRGWYPQKATETEFPDTWTNWNNLLTVQEHKMSMKQEYKVGGRPLRICKYKSTAVPL